MIAWTDECLMRGAMACRAGKPIEACPYATRKERSAWTRGWVMQRALGRGVR